MDGHNVTIGVAEAESLTKGTVDGVSDNRDASLNQALVQRLGVTDMEPQGNAETRSRRHCFQVDSRERFSDRERDRFGGEDDRVLWAVRGAREPQVAVISNSLTSVH